MSPRYLAPSDLIHSTEVSPARYPAPAMHVIPGPCAPYLAPRMHHILRPCISERAISCARVNARPVV